MRCKCCNSIMDTSGYQIQPVSKQDGVPVEEDLCTVCRYEVRYCGEGPKGKWYACEGVHNGVTLLPNYGLDYETDELYQDN